MSFAAHDGYRDSRRRSCDRRLGLSATATAWRARCANLPSWRTSCACAHTNSGSFDTSVPMTHARTDTRQMTHARTTLCRHDCNDQGATRLSHSVPLVGITRYWGTMPFPQAPRPGPVTFVTHISHQIGFGFDCFMHSSESMPSRRLPSVLKTHITPLLKACLYYKEI